MVIWQPSVLIKDEKFFSKGENWMGEKNVILNFDQYEYSQCGLLVSNGADRL